jgi:hypothetical protein
VILSLLFLFVRQHQPSWALSSLLRLKGLLEQAQPLIAKRLKVG